MTRTKDLLTKKTFWIITLNSTVSFVFSYLIVFYFNQFFYLLIGLLKGFPVEISYSYFGYHIEPWQWTKKVVLLTYSFGYIATLILGILTVIAFRSMLRESFPIKIFFLWLAFHCFTYFFAGIMLGNLLKDGMGHFFVWLQLGSNVFHLILALIGFLGLLLTAIMFVRNVGYTANAYFKKYTDETRPFFISAQVFVPFLMGSVVLLAYFFPNYMMHERYNFFVYLGMICFFFLGLRQSNDLRFSQQKDLKIHLMSRFILLAVFFTLLTRIIFHKGILFSL